MSNKKYMIVLTGQGDTRITLANLEAETWICSPYPKMNRGSAIEQIPDDVLVDNEKWRCREEDSIQVTVGSGRNDRAMAAPGPRFYSLMEAMEYIRENNIEITGEFSGAIY